MSIRNGSDTIFGGRRAANAGRFSLWEYRDLLMNLVVRNIRVKYRASVLGFAWTLFNPLVMLGLLLVVFSHIVRIPIEHYWAFLISGFFVWNYISQTLNYGAQVISEHGGLVRNYSFPSEITVFGGALSRLFEFTIEMVLISLIITILHHGAVQVSLVLIPLLIVLQLFLTVGIALIVATLGVFYEDVKHMLPLALSALFYVSPIFYTIDLVPNGIRQIFLLNPVAHLLICYQSVLYRGQFPPWLSLLAVVVASTVLFAAGTFVFRRYRGILAEII